MESYVRNVQRRPQSVSFASTFLYLVFLSMTKLTFLCRYCFSFHGQIICGFESRYNNHRAIVSPNLICDLIGQKDSLQGQWTNRAQVHMLLVYIYICDTKRIHQLAILGIHIIRSHFHILLFTYTYIMTSSSTAAAAAD